MRGLPSRAYSPGNRVLQVVLTLVSLTVLRIDGVPVVILSSSGVMLNESVIVGNASDVIVEIQCSSSSSRNTWSRGGMLVPEPLMVFGESQDPVTGLLRIYDPSTVLSWPGPVQYTCTTADNRTATISLILAESLFFVSPVPTSVSMELQPSDCQVPDIPEAQISVVRDQDTNRDYCLIETERGSFSSGFVDMSTPQQVDPTFTTQPVNTSAATGRTAAFSCAVSPENTDLYTLVNIAWMFESAQVNMASGMGALEPNITNNSIPVVEQVGMVEIIDGLPQSGVSVLALYNVSELGAGFYYCVANYQLSNGSVLQVESDPAFLNVNESLTSQLTLTPPLAVMANEGSNLSLPCVTADGSVPSWSPPSVGMADEFTLNILSVSRELNGTELTCQFNSETASVLVTVLAPLVFTEAPSNETIVSPGETVTLTCTASSNPPPGPVTWLVNNTAINFTANDQVVQLSETSIAISDIQTANAGIYQCLYQQDTGTAIVSIAAYTYLNVHFLGDASVAPLEMDVILLEPETPDNVALDCVVPSQPAVRLTWTNVTSGEEIGVAQTVTGFRGPSRSQLVVDTSLLAGTTQYRCSAELLGNTTDAVSTINAYSMVTFLEQPVDPENPLLVGMTVSFLCQAASVPAPVITWFRYEQSGSVALENGSDPMVTIVEEVVNGSVVSNISIVLELDGFTQYYCVANNTFFTNRSINATVTQGVEVQLSLEPLEVRAIPGQDVVFVCNASGLPGPPDITWRVRNNNSHGAEFVPVVDGGIYQIRQLDPASSTMSSALTASSTLTVRNVNVSMNETEFQCVGENLFGPNISTALLLVAGPPSIPFLFPAIAKARSVNVSWSQPFSLIQITHYTIELLLSHGNDSIETEVLVRDDPLWVVFDGLTPHTEYTVRVLAANAAGNSEAIGEPFFTMQDVPGGPPTNIISSASVLGEIFLSWQPPLEELQNGDITDYLIHYQVVAEQATAAMQRTEDTSYTLTGLEDGVQYMIQLQAGTSIGFGNFSTLIFQSTIAAPPALDDSPLVQPVDSPPTSSSIPVQISSFSTNDVEQLWVVAIKLNSSIQSAILSSTPDVLYPNNNSFIFASQVASIPFGVPYIAAEITASSIGLPYTFFLGSDSQPSVNDFPNLYSNPPLAESTTYTAFVRAFPPAVNSNSISKRQAGSSSPARQYTIFTSTDFLPAVTTSQELSAGAIVGILFSVVLGIIIAVVIGLIIYIVLGRMRAKSLPPPARRGSVRLSKNKIIFNSAAGDSVALVRSHRGNTELSDMRSPEDKEAIPILRFPEYVKSLHANSDHLFAEDFDQIGIQSPSKAHQGSSLLCNIPRNRYGNINCYDETRVFLRAVEGIPGSDYINANYIDGYNKAGMYIATQGPLPETTPDFWRMVWEQQSCCIVMLTNCVEKGRPKCHQYWPQTGSISFGNLSVTIVDTQVLAYYTIRTFRMNMGNDRREVKQFHYTAWPDFGVPDHPNPIISFVRRLNNFERTTPGPDVIHCSAGVGRTGTYITIQSMMRMIDAEGKVDVFNFVLNMRHQRNFMVQTEQQYIFIHDAVVEIIRVGKTEMMVQNMRKELKRLQRPNSDSEVCPLREQFDKLNDLDIPNPAQFVAATLPANKTKNRFGDIIPYEAYRVKLLMMPGVSGSDYINASYVDGYLRKNQFILTQGPMQSTVNDFWRLVWEQRASAIVMLCQLEEKGKEQSARYWPEEKATQYGDLFVEATSTKETKTFTVREFMVTHSKENEVRSLKQFHYTDWPEDECPESSTSLLSMITQVQRAHHQFGGGPVIVHDSSSVGRAGTFCVLNIVIEKLKVEGMVDVFFTAHSLRRKHPGIVANYDQYVFCFNTIIEFLDSFDQYANFD